MTTRCQGTALWPKHFSDTTVFPGPCSTFLFLRVSFPGFMLEPWNGLGTNEVAAVDSWIAVREDFISKEERARGGRAGGGVLERQQSQRGGGGESGKKGPKVGGEEGREPAGKSQGGGGERAR